MKVAAASAWQEVLRFLFVNVPGAVIWIALNLLFIAKLGFPVYGRLREEMSTQAPESSPLPDFCKGAAIGTLSDLWAISAEEHYLRLRGRFGTKMIRHSFGTALEQIPPDTGLQVHRSHWVAFGQVAGIETGKVSQIVLPDGGLIPVSGRYQEAVRLTEDRLRLRAAAGHRPVSLTFQP
jgi:hypothetical protein